MVFESVIADVLNRTLGSYVENLNRSQLQVGIWGGDVVLTNLEIKQSALSELDLPIQTIYGRLGKLVLKIPWKYLYTAPVEVTIEDLYLLAAPDKAVAYNAEKEDQKLLEQKQLELQRVEIAKAKSEIKDVIVKDDSFVEKLISQIIKNLQVSIRNIHIRYEDKTTNPKMPFSLGITLSSLSMLTTDETWRIGSNESLTKIFKIVSLEGFAVYWNCKSLCLASLSTKELLEYFTKTIATRDMVPEGFSYMLGPINSTARLRLNPKPEQDVPEFSFPKISLNLNMEKLSIALTKYQYQDLLLLADSMERMNKARPYRKYRPNVDSYKGNYKLWWKFAYDCILNEEVRRVKRNWDWNNMCEHKKMCRDYAFAYKHKIQDKKVPPDVQKTLDTCEKRIDLYSLVIIRQKIQSEVERLAKATEEERKNKGWFGSFWGSSSKSNGENDLSLDIMKKFENAMSPDEKKKLYRAIDYTENSSPTEYPITYVDTQMIFVLEKLDLKVLDSDADCVLQTDLQGVQCHLEQRPAGSALKIKLLIDGLTVLGLQQPNYRPQIVTVRKHNDNSHLLDVMFETNPLDQECDQRLHVYSRPLQILFDTETANKMIDVFKPPSCLAGDDVYALQQQATSRLAGIKEMSATGLQHVVQGRSYLEIKIDVMAPYFIVPYGGIYTGNESVLVLDLGRLQVDTKPRSKEHNVAVLHQKGLTEEEVFDKMKDQSYDIFEIQTTDIQVLFALANEDWYSYVMEEGAKSVSPYHLMQPTSIVIRIYKCLILEDPRLPKVKINGSLHYIHINSTEERIVELLSLAQSIKINSDNEPVPLSESHHRSSSLSLLRYLDGSEKSEEKKKVAKIDLDQIQFTDLKVEFEMKEILITLSTNAVKNVSKASIESTDSNPQEVNDIFLAFHILAVELSFIQMTYDTIAKVRLGGIGLKHYREQGVMNIISTLMTDGQEDYLFTIDYLKVDCRSPVFNSKHMCVEQLLNLHFTTLHVIVHQESYSEIMQKMGHIQSLLQAEQTEQKEGYTYTTVAVESIKKLATVLEETTDTHDQASAVVPIPKVKRGKVIDRVLLKLNAKLDEVAIELGMDMRPVANLSVTGLNVDLITKESYTQVGVELTNITLLDRNPTTMHKKILTVKEANALKCKLVMFNLDHSTEFNQNDMSVVATVGCVHVVFLNWFVTTLLEFLNHFTQAVEAFMTKAADAAEGVMQTMTDTKKATRIELNIEIHAPYIIVPINSKSQNILIMDLGFMSLNNSFNFHDAKSDNGTSAIVDEINLKVSELKLSMAELHYDTGVVTHDAQLMKPVSFNLICKRNLSASWYNCIPDIDLCGKIVSIELRMSQTDYGRMLQIVAQNMSEGQKSPAAAPPQSPAATPSIVNSTELDWKASENLVDNQMSTQPSSNTIIAKPKKQLEKSSHLEVHQSLKFSFTMDTFILDLYMVNTPKVSSPGQLSYTGLARFSFHVLAIKGNILTDNTISTSILLVDCLLDDTRPGRENKLSRYIERKNREETVRTEMPLRSMLDVTIQITGNDTFIDIRVFSFNLILSMDYLLGIGDFFTKVMQSPTPTESPPVVSNVAPKSKSFVSKKSLKVSPPQPIETEKVKMLTINLRVEKPDIILVESMDDINCNALVLNSEIIFKLRVIGNHQVVNGTVKNLTLFTCIYNPDERADSEYIILKPCSLSIAGSTPQDSGLHIDLCVTNVRMCVSPGLVELLNKIKVTMNSNKVLSICEEIEVKDHSDLWDQRSFEESDHWFLKMDEEGKDVLTALASLAFEPVAESSMVVRPQEELCLISVPSIVFTLEAGDGTKTLPMILLETSLQASVQNWSSKMAVDSTLRVQMSYYNSNLALWEPFIEPIATTTADNQIALLPWELRLEVVMNSVAEDAEENVIQPAAMCINVSSKDNLELTFTKTTLDVLSTLGKAFGDVMHEDEDYFEKKGRSAPYKFINDTGLDVTLILRNSPFQPFKQSGYVEVLLGSGAQADLELKPEEESHTSLHIQNIGNAKALEQHERYINIKVSDINFELKINVTRAAMRYFPLKYRGESGDNWGLVSEVHVEDAMTVVTVRSIVQAMHISNMDPDFAHVWTKIASLLTRVKSLPTGCESPLERFCADRSSRDSHPVGNDFTLVSKDAIFVQTCARSGSISDICVAWSVPYKVNGISLITNNQLKVYNHLNTPIDVYYMKRQGNEVECVGTVEPDSFLNLPLKAVYTTTNEIFFSLPGFKLSIVPFIWKELQSTGSFTKMMQCEAKDKFNKDPFFIKAIGELKQIYNENTARFNLSSICYNIHLRPAFVLYNNLPISILVCIQLSEITIIPGDSLQLPNIEPGLSTIVIKLLNYLDKEWSCRHDIPATFDVFTVWTFDSYDSAQKVSLDLGMHTIYKSGSQTMSLYCPFWMINKTGLTLSYMKSRKTERNELNGTSNQHYDESANVLYHPETFAGPIMFSYRARHFFGKKLASVRVDNGEWSKSFSLDVAGSSGVVQCKANSMRYQIGVTIHLTSNSLTKQVTFSPYYAIINQSATIIECQESDRPGDPWISLLPMSCTPLWPKSERNDKVLRLRCNDEPEITVPFVYTEVQTSLLKLLNKYGGINVEVQVSEGSTYVTIKTYEPGMAPALIINHTKEVVKIWEKESINVRSIDSYNKMFYTWENPAGPRILVFNKNQKDDLEIDIRMDDFDKFIYNHDTFYWVSFLDGMQRVLLVTDDKNSALGASNAGDLAVVDQEITVSIHGIGLSLVNNLKFQEVLYLGIASSGIIWEVAKMKSQRYKALSTNESVMIEDAYRRFQSEGLVGIKGISSRVIIDPKTEVDFLEEGNYLMLRPHHRKLRRRFNTGLWLELKTTPYTVQLHAKLNRLQIDNQMQDCVFPVVLAPIKPSKTLGENAMKPFAELSIVQRILKHSHIQQYKYFKILIQEFSVKLDLVFINALNDLFEADAATEEEAFELFTNDLKTVNQTLHELVSQYSELEKKNFYDLLHFSPLKIHVSFSMTGSGGGVTEDAPQFISVLLQSIGVTLTDLHDVIFKLGYFEREFTFLSQKQLISEATMHYVGQAVKQLYVLVLGLDVIGNPFGLVIGITKGMEDLFYEPFQGAIQGPGEFAEGIVLGVRSLFGHTVGGAAGAVSRITGAMGKGLAVLTFDKDYQRKRRDQLKHRPANIQEGLARSGKGLVMGVVDGVTGVFTKPIAGAKEQGVEGFFKGLGKGAVGLVTRPTAGIVDFASGSFDAVKRATQLSDEVVRLRPPRLLQPDGVVRPYNKTEAEGYKILCELEKGRYAKTDEYQYHVVIIQDKDILLLTDKRVAYLTVNEVFGGWQVEWSYTWQEIKVPVRVTDRGVMINVDEHKKKVFGLFGTTDSGKVILIPPNSRVALAEKMESLRTKV